MKQSIWLSGSKGYVGSYLFKHLKKLDYFVECISNTNSENNDIIYIDYSKPREIYKALDKYN